MLEVVATTLSIIEAIFVARKDCRGFYFWLVANPLWVIFGILNQYYGQALLFTVYTFITGYGLFEWKNKK